MKEFKAKLISVHSGNNDDMSKPAHASLLLEEDGFTDDKHRGFTRIAADWDPEPTGTLRRNERQWSGVSVEELSIIQDKMDLREALSPVTLGANICVEGIPEFSMLPKGSMLIFPSAAVLIVEEENDPCLDMGLEIERCYQTNSGEKVAGKMFPKHAIHCRGVVGVVDVGGLINCGDEITVKVYDAPAWAG